MQNYHDLMQEVLDHGQFKPNRTGTGTYASVGHTLKYDLRKAFPATTTKKLFFAQVKGEVVGFFRGCTSAAQFRALGCKVWDANANETQAWLDNPARKGVDDLGRIYGAQWTDWKDWREVKTDAEFADFSAKGYELVAHDADRGVRVMRKGLNQLEMALHTLLTDPYDRGITVTGWRPDEFDRMALRPCHAEYRFIAMPDGCLNMSCAIRSNDLFLGHPFNAASCGVFLSIMARLAGFTAAEVIIFVTDAHIYSDHVSQVRLQLSRDHLPAPTLALSEKIRKIENLEDIKGVFTRIETEDISLKDYVSHPAISGKMAA